MEHYKSIFKKKEEIKESKEGSDVYKALGNVFKLIKNTDFSILTPQEKKSIKDRTQEIFDFVMGYR